MKRYAPIFVAGLVLAFAGGIALANSNEILACINPNGLTFVVDDLSECGNNDTALRWNTEGVAGPQGPAGEDGAPGAEGPEGPAGQDGRTLAWYAKNDQGFYVSGWNNPTAILEMEFEMPESGALHVTANTSLLERPGRVAFWLQLDNRTCVLPGFPRQPEVTAIDFGYGSVDGQTNWIDDVSLDGIVSAADGAHTLTFCAEIYGGSTTSTLLGSSMTAVFVDEAIDSRIAP